jgi:peptidoglycan/xylan/chitin deacetylase (PgdA/CDA1 family)
MIRFLVASALLLASLQAHPLVILQYHHISTETPAATSTPPELFERHLAIIEESGFEVVDLETVATWLRTGETLPDKTVLITFDDSYPSIYEAAFPLLEQRGWPFVIFANTEPVDAARPGFLSWAQLREMAGHGAAIANHTHRHLHLVRRPGDTPAPAWRERVKREIQHAEARIEANTGHSHRVLAFPYGEFDGALLDLLEELGFLGMSQSSGAVARGEAPALPRFPMGGRYGEPGDFTLKLQALPLPVDELVVKDESGGRLPDSLLPASVTRPVIELRLADAALKPGLQCYATGQTAAVDKTVRGEWLRFQTDLPLPAGRSRYNCTARDAQTGRYHWYSVPFLRPGKDGSWPPEP